LKRKKQREDSSWRVSIWLSFDACYIDLLSSAAAPREEEDFSWDADEEESSSPAKSDAQSAPMAKQSSNDTLSPTTKFTSVGVDKDGNGNGSGTGISTAQTSPRHSSDDGTMSSYDVVSTGEPEKKDVNEEEDKAEKSQVKKEVQDNKDDDEDSDWE
jgi:hypothetical protein